VRYSAIAVEHGLIGGEVDHDAGTPFAQSCWIGACCLSLAVDFNGI